MTFDGTSERYDHFLGRNGRTRGGTCAKITVELCDIMVSLNAKIFISIDGRQTSVTARGRPSTVNVKAGVHKISVFFSRRSKNPSISIPLTIAPGDFVHLRFGMRAEWCRFAIVESLLCRAIGVSGYVVAVLGWVFFPLLRELTSSAVIRYKIDGRSLNLIYFPVSNRYVTVCLLMLAWLVCASSVVFGLRFNVRRRLQARVGQPFFLETLKPHP